MSDALDFVRIDGDDLHVVGSVVASIEGDAENVRPDYPNGTTRVTLTDGTVFAAKFGHVFIWEDLDSFPDNVPAASVTRGDKVWCGTEWLRVIHTAGYYGGNDQWWVTIWYPDTSVTLAGSELLSVRHGD